jgi:hypothetical protein
MSRLSHTRERETDEEPGARDTAAAPPAQSAPVGPLVWASAVGNQAVQRLARRTVAREAVEEEDELEQSAPEPEPVEEAAPAAEDAAPEGFAPEEAAGLAALDDLPEDELPA